jgi:type III restriction enzyme
MGEFSKRIGVIGEDIVVDFLALIGWNGKTILLETKGDHLDAEQKIRLDRLWASKAGNNYRYFMVYERRTVDGAYKLEDFLNIIKDI